MKIVRYNILFLQLESRRVIIMEEHVNYNKCIREVLLTLIGHD